MSYPTGYRVTKQFLNDQIERILHYCKYVFESDSQGLELITGECIHRTDLRLIFKKIDDAIKSLSWNSASDSKKWVKQETWEDSSLLGTGFPATDFYVNFDDTKHYSQSELETLLTVDGYNIVNASSLDYTKYSKALYWNSIDILFNQVFKYFFVKNRGSFPEDPFYTDERSPYFSIEDGYEDIFLQTTPEIDYDDGTYFTTNINNPATKSNPSDVLDIYVNKLSTEAYTQLRSSRSVWSVHADYRIYDGKLWGYGLLASPNYFNYHSSDFDDGLTMIAKNLGYIRVPTEVEMRSVMIVFENYSHHRISEDGVVISETWTAYNAGVPFYEQSQHGSQVPLFTLPTTTTTSIVDGLVQTALISSYTDLLDTYVAKIPNATNPTATPNVEIGNSENYDNDIWINAAGIMIKIPDMPTE